MKNRVSRMAGPPKKKKERSAVLTTLTGFPLFLLTLRFGVLLSSLLGLSIIGLIETVASTLRALATLPLATALSALTALSLIAALPALAALPLAAVLPSLATLPLAAALPALATLPLPAALSALATLSLAAALLDGPVTPGLVGHVSLLSPDWTGGCRSK
jgi:hypothetical protein